MMNAFIKQYKLVQPCIPQFGLSYPVQLYKLGSLYRRIATIGIQNYSSFTSQQCHFSISIIPPIRYPQETHSLFTRQVQVITSLSDQEAQEVIQHAEKKLQELKDKEMEQIFLRLKSLADECSSNCLTEVPDSELKNIGIELLSNINEVIRQTKETNISLTFYSIMRTVIDRKIDDYKQEWDIIFEEADSCLKDKAQKANSKIQQMYDNYFTLIKAYDPIFTKKEIIYYKYIHY